MSESKSTVSKRKCCVCASERFLISCTFDATQWLCPDCTHLGRNLFMNVPKEILAPDMDDTRWALLVKISKLESDALHKIRFG